MNGWIGVDLDGTLAHYEKWVAPDDIGAPIMPMILRVQQWLSDGKDVRIFTARGSIDAADRLIAYPAIEEWCRRHIGRALPITNVKDIYMIALYDDRAFRVQANTGIIHDDGKDSLVACDEALAKVAAPIQIILPCPRCGLLHVDAPEPHRGWTNPPHKSHLCHRCGTVWRPADVPTVGVAAIATRGEKDSWNPDTGKRVAMAISDQVPEPGMKMISRSDGWISVQRQMPRPGRYVAPPDAERIEALMRVEVREIINREQLVEGSCDERLTSRIVNRIVPTLMSAVINDYMDKGVDHCGGLSKVPRSERGNGQCSST